MKYFGLPRTSSWAFAKLSIIGFVRVLLSMMVGEDVWVMVSVSPLRHCNGDHSLLGRCLSLLKESFWSRYPTQKPPVIRPILMTSIAFILGVAPLLFATGAGAEMRTALGTAVFAGMLGVTAFGIFLTPAFYIIVDRARAGTFFQDSAIRFLGTALRWTFALGFVRPLFALAFKKTPR